MLHSALHTPPAAGASNNLTLATSSSAQFLCRQAHSMYVTLGSILRGGGERDTAMALCLTSMQDTRGRGIHRKRSIVSVSFGINGAMKRFAVPRRGI